MKLSCVLLAMASSTATTLASAQQEAYIVPPAMSVSEARYAEWAHKHWIWLSGGQGSQEACKDLVEGYLSRGIALGSLNIDSQWATSFNNFDEKKVRQRGVRGEG